ncbi:MAG TPA: SHOCT domain-containing protein [Solirubrobacteraceae bacterium]|nr:SHOCT domain-containing protein [Solirubrobacteraceae bacterium]
MAEDSHERAGDGGDAVGSSSGSPPPPSSTGAVAGVPATGNAHRIWVRVILVIATLLAVFAIFAVWANRQLLNPSNWARTSTSLLQKETIRTALAGYLIDQLYANVNVPGELKSGLPTQLKPLAGPLAGGLHSLAEQGAEKALSTTRVQNIWSRANHAADQTLVTIVAGGGKRVQIQGGTVSLNLRQIVADVAQRLGLPSSVAEKLPASVANLKVVSSSQLGLVRNLAKALHALALWLVIIVLALYALAVFLAHDHRRRTLMWVGLSLVLAGLLVLIGRKVGQGQLVSAITSDASVEPAANDAYSVATSLLVQVASSVIIIGIPVILSAWFAGPARWAVAGRRFLAPHFRKRPELAYWITAALLVLLFIWAPIPATSNPWWMLLFTVLSFFGAHVLRGQIAEEFPDAEAISLRTSFREHTQHMGEKVSRARAAAAPAAGGGGSSTAAELERLAALHERGSIDDEEYTAAKRQVLSVSQ